MRLGRSLRNGLICCLSFAIVAGLLASGFFQNMENRVFDAHMRSHQLLVNEDIVLITVDDYSVEKISEWPISSDLIAKTFDYII
ncbi:MAG: CHASE2 domain-containing protein, partial [Gammaproteobacteria bacterium]|nr:CHASE2 domain-containing protein [Gammaproteobacteria bacterium]